MAHDQGPGQVTMAHSLHGGSDGAQQREGSGGKPPSMPKILGDTEQAVRVVKEYGRLLLTDEFQTMFNELNFKNPDVMLELEKVQLQLSLRTLESVGLDHLKPMFGLDKIQTIVIVFVMAYADDPEVMKEAGFVNPHGKKNQPSKCIDVGDAVPNLDLVTLDGATVNLPDLHVNKDRPMMILASSAS